MSGVRRTSYRFVENYVSYNFYMICAILDIRKSSHKLMKIGYIQLQCIFDFIKHKDVRKLMLKMSVKYEKMDPDPLY